MWQQSLSSHHIRYTCAHCTDKRPFVGVPGHFPPLAVFPASLVTDSRLGKTEVGWDVETNFIENFPTFFPSFSEKTFVCLCDFSGSTF